MRRVSASGLPLPALGQGGWQLGDNPDRAPQEIEALRLGLDLGLTLIDTAEMYGSGRSERLIGRAMEGRPRDSYQLVSKVLPQNAGRRHIFQSCEASLARLQTDYLDLYLLHWRGTVPLAETVECMETLVQAGKIRRWGVSNFDTADMEELWRIQDGQRCAVNQVLYNLGSRGIEFDLLPWLAAHGVAAMAYCPVAQAGALKRMHKDFYKDPTLAAIAKKYAVSVTQLLLAFTLRQAHVIAIPKAANPAHVKENAAAAALIAAPEDWAQIDRVFWPPTAKMHLDIE
ncbi:MAG TPA: aldo/keto reductase [Candidatus Limiplasma sp.]|nr:aldo/keto reductase [Candidatus Limiplasma sp.]